MIAELLEHGAEKAMTKVELMAATGLSERAVRNAIEKERQQGALILSDVDGAGYFLPGCETEVRKYVAQQTHRARTIFYGLKTARSYLKEIEDGEEKNCPTV